MDPSRSTHYHGNVEKRNPPKKYKPPINNGPLCLDLKPSISYMSAITFFAGLLPTTPLACTLHPLPCQGQWRWWDRHSQCSRCQCHRHHQLHHYHHVRSGKIWRDRHNQPTCSHQHHQHHHHLHHQVRSSEASTTSPPISTGSPGEQHQLRYDLMPPILPPGEHGHAEGPSQPCFSEAFYLVFLFHLKICSLCSLLENQLSREQSLKLFLIRLWAETLKWTCADGSPLFLCLTKIQFIHGSLLCLAWASINCANELLWWRPSAIIIVHKRLQGLWIAVRF